jgi:hypothetical protein
MYKSTWVKELEMEKLAFENGTEPFQDKPPLGLRPEYIWKERCKSNRIQEIVEAMERYRKVEYDIPEKWQKELFKLLHE